MKKILSLILVAVMAIGVLIVQNVFAETTLQEVEFAMALSDVPTDSSYYESVKDVFVSDIMRGYPDCTFGIDKQITRAEMAKVIMLTMGTEKTQDILPIEREVTSTFTDVETTHWAYDYIEMASNLQIINGNGDGTFLPDNNITYGEVIKMIVCAMGYEAMAQSRGMGYPTGYAQVVADLGITKGISFVLEHSATRGDVAKLIHTALDLPIMEQRINVNDNSVEYIIMDGKNGIDLKTLRMKRRNITKSEEITEAEVAKAFEEDYLKSKAISLVTMADGVVALEIIGTGL